MRGSAYTAVTTIPLALILVLVGCTASPKKPSEVRAVLFDQPVSNVRTAAENALVVTGFKITKREEFYLQGTRPRKVGLFVGSGGEAVGVWLRADAPDRTRVLVTTDKTFAGYAGQRNWDDEILEEMRRDLGHAAP